MKSYNSIQVFPSNLLLGMAAPDLVEWQCYMKTPHLPPKFTTVLLASQASVSRVLPSSESFEFD